jgi:phage/plasmid-associated DNA primase
LERYQAENDELAAWFDEHTTACPDVAVPQSELHGAYTRHCRRSYRRPASKQMFGRRLRTLRPQALSAQRTVAGRRTWVYAGISLKSDPEAGAFDQLDRSGGPSATIPAV